MPDKKRIDGAIRVLLLPVLYFGLAFLGTTLLIALVSKLFPEIFDMLTSMWVFIWGTLRSILNEFMYDIFGV
jgi:hypothetical protein